MRVPKVYGKPPISQAKGQRKLGFSLSLESAAKQTLTLIGRR